LLGEGFDAAPDPQTGNFPQALTHIALINTAHNLSEAKPSTDKPAMQRSK
jgi:GH15 family glucan-1,4-alpha-glucosidase